MGDAAFVEEALKKIQGHKGVRGVMVINGDGIPIRHAIHVLLYCPGWVRRLAGKLQRD